MNQMTPNDTARPRSTTTFHVVLWLAVPLALYVGSYFALLERKVYWQTGVDPATGINLFKIAPAYRIERLAWLVAPVHTADREIRRDYWQTIEHSSGRKWKNPAADEE